MFLCCGTRFLPPSRLEKRKRLRFRTQSYEITKQLRVQIEKTFQIFFSHLQSGHEPRVLSSTTSQQLRKSSRLIGKRCGIYSTARSNSLLHPETSSTDAYTRAYTHSANFRFLPSPFTAERISLILWRLSVKKNHRNAFTPCRDTRSPPPRIQNALATTDEL